MRAQHAKALAVSGTLCAFAQSARQLVANNVLWTTMRLHPVNVLSIAVGIVRNYNMPKLCLHSRSDKSIVTVDALSGHTPSWAFVSNLPFFRRQLV